MMTKATFKLCNLCNAVNGLRIRRCGKCGERPAFRAPNSIEIAAREAHRAAFEVMLDKLVGAE